MKIIAIDNAYAASQATEPSLVVYPDSSVFRNNEPFFIPDLAKKVIVRAGCVLKIERIGKCIAPQFARRYFSAVGIAFDFIQTDLMKDLLLKNMSTGPAVYFDKSFAISNLFIEKEAFEQPRSSYRVKLNDTELTLTEKSARYDFGEAIARCSEYFTLKIGDLVFVPAVSFDKGIKQGDIIDGVYGNDVLIRCQVK